jgi:hypothetical protein
VVVTNAVGDAGLTNYLVSYVPGVLTVTTPGKVTITSIGLIDTNHMLIIGAGTPGVVYTIQASSDLINWQSIGTATADTNGLFRYVDYNAGNFTKLFYRVFLAVTPPGNIAISSIGLAGVNQAMITGTGTASMVYMIQASSDLVNWQNIGTATADGNGVFQYQDATISANSQRFYRVSSK